MRWGSKFKAIAMAMSLLVPVEAQAASVFDDAMAGSGDFAMFPFWQKVLADAQPLAARMVAPDPAPALTPAATTDAALGPMPAVFSIGLPAGCTEERHCAPPEWLSFLSSQNGRAPMAQLEAVNQWANAKPYVEDWANWHVADYWETPGEFIARGGDCEDFAIAKYFSLIRLGFAAQDLRIVVVSDATTRGFHAVLAARLDGIVWLLDNFLPAIVPMESQPQYSAVYSLNQQGWWMHSNPTVQLAGLTIVASPVAVDWQKVARN